MRFVEDKKRIYWAAMLDQLTKDKLDGRVGQTFRISAGEEASIDATLIECAAMGGDRGESGREPFSLVFHGPAEPFFGQALYRVSHAELGELDLFLVPLGPHKGEGMRYEAVFT